MKVIYVLTFVLTATLFSSCSDSEEDSVPPYLYTFHLKFVDAENNNLLMEEDENLLVANFGVDPSSENDVESFEVKSELIGDELFFKVSVSSRPTQRLEKINFFFKSEKIFNSDEICKIKTVWSWDNELDNSPKEVFWDDSSLPANVVTSEFKYFLITQ